MVEKTTNNMKIVALYRTGYTTSLHVRAIAKLLGTSHVTILPHLKQLEKIKVLQHEKVVRNKQYLLNKKHFSWKKEEIMHDPTLMVVSAPEAEKVEVQPEPVPEPPKKQSYFGSEKHKADLALKKQLKNEAK